MRSAAGAGRGDDIRHAFAIDIAGRGTGQTQGNMSRTA
jgi:hypothetical protein